MASIKLNSQEIVSFKSSTSKHLLSSSVVFDPVLLKMLHPVIDYTYNSVNYRVHIFKSSGTFYTPVEVQNCDVIVQAGGGAGGHSVAGDGGTGGVPIIKVDGGEIVAGAGGAFKVKTDGTMSASSAWFSGHIQAYSGELHELFIKNEVVLDDAAGKIRTDDNSVILTNTSFTMTSGDITLGSPAKLYLKDSGQITASAALITGSDVNIDVENFSAKGDSVYISSSNFLLENGNISASNVNLAGHVTAETGNIGGWVVEAGRLYSTGPSGGSVALDSDRSGFVVKNAYGKDRVYVGDKSLGEITGSANESTNGSFEVTGSNAQDVPGWRIETTNSATYAVTSSQNITVDLLSLLKIENPAGTAP